MIVDNGKYYIYRHIRTDTNEVFYVGKGTKFKWDNEFNRPSVYKRATDVDSRNNQWHKVANKATYTVEILVESNDKNFINEKEMEFIKLYGRMDLGLGTLVNFTDGGDFYGKKADVSIRKTIETKRKRGNLSNIKNLVEWNKLGIYGMAKKTYLYKDTGEYIKEFSSLVECGKYTNTSAAFIGEKRRDKKSFKGYVASDTYYGEMIDRGKYYNCTQIKSIFKICPLTLSVLKRYSKMTDAANEQGVSLKNISEAVIEKSRCNGFYWIYESEFDILGQIQFTKVGKPVFGVNVQGEKMEFSSGKDAEKYINTSKGSVCAAIKSGGYLKGHKWYYSLNQQKQS